MFNFDISSIKLVNIACCQQAKLAKTKMLAFVT